MSKKCFLLSLLTTMMVAMLSVGFSACGGDDDDNNNPNNGQPLNPSTTVNDPEGTVSLSMRNADNGKTYLDNIYIKNENFCGANFASVGSVKGLGNISTIPTIGWADQMSVIAGNGYIAYCNDRFYRIYVISDIIGTTGGIIGADIKYQKPFKGTDEDLQISKDFIEANSKAGNYGEIIIKNHNIVPFDVEVDKTWCTVSKHYFSEHGISVYVYCAENASDIPRDANITLTTMYGKKKTIKVQQMGWELKGDGTINNPFNVISALIYTYALGADNESSKDIYIKGRISEIQEAFSTGWGNATFKITDSGDYESNHFRAFRVLYLGNQRYVSGDKQINIGDEVIICGRVVNYKGNTPETIANKAYIYSLNGLTK